MQRNIFSAAVSEGDKTDDTSGPEDGGHRDAVFGTASKDGPKYRSVGWIGTVVLMAKSMIGLGVLSIPSAFNVLGLIPGTICLLVVATITTWSMQVVGQFKLNHPEVYGIEDAGFRMFGVWGREFLGGAFLLYWIFVLGSGLLGISIALNAVSTHAACTAVFVAISAVVVVILASIQTLGKLSWLAWVGLISILTAIFTVTIAVGLQDRPASAPQTGHWESDFKLFTNPTFLEACSAVSSLIFSYAGTTLFFGFAAEMKQPELYSRSLKVCQSIVTGTYLTIGIVVYIYCGSYVSNPAMGSAGPLLKKISYGIAIPGVAVSTILISHMAAKYLFVRLTRDTNHISSNSLRHWVTWLSCISGVVIIGYIIASSIPVFGTLVSLVGALLGTLMSFQPMAGMWLYENWNKDRNVRWHLMVAWSAFVIVSGTLMMVAGTYGSVVEIIDGYKKSGGSAAWSCADNSNSV